MKSFFRHHCLVFLISACLSSTLVLWATLKVGIGNVTGKGRGRQVIAVARTADLIIMMLDAVKGDVQRYANWSVTAFPVFT